MLETPDQQISLTDPDARAMRTAGSGTSIVGYNVQTAVDARHHLIVAHEVTNVGNDRSQLVNMATQAKEATHCDDLWLIVATSTARRFWLAIKRASLRTYPRHKPRTTRPKDSTASGTLSIGLKRMNMNVRRESA